MFSRLRRQQNQNGIATTRSGNARWRRQQQNNRNENQEEGPDFARNVTPSDISSSNNSNSFIRSIDFDEGGEETISSMNTSNDHGSFIINPAFAGRQLTFDTGPDIVEYYDNNNNNNNNNNINNSPRSPIRIVGPADDTNFEQNEPSLLENGGPSLLIVDCPTVDYSEENTTTSSPTLDNGDIDHNFHQEHSFDEYENQDNRVCNGVRGNSNRVCPLWVINASPEIKMLIAGSCILLLGAIGIICFVLAAGIGGSNGNNETNSATSSTTDTNMPTTVPTSSPSLMTFPSPRDTVATTIQTYQLTNVTEILKNTSLTLFERLIDQELTNSIPKEEIKDVKVTVKNQKITSISNNNIIESTEKYNSSSTVSSLNNSNRRQLKIDSNNSFSTSNSDRYLQVIKVLEVQCDVSYVGLCGSTDVEDHCTYHIISKSVATFNDNSVTSQMQQTLYEETGYTSSSIELKDVFLVSTTPHWSNKPSSSPVRTTQAPTVTTPTIYPSIMTTFSQSNVPTEMTTVQPTKVPTSYLTSTPPTKVPTSYPTLTPPTKIPSPFPTKVAMPTPNPTRKKTKKPTQPPTNFPSLRPTRKPTLDSTLAPIPVAKTVMPTPDQTTLKPTQKPTLKPSKNPTQIPTKKPTRKPTPRPSPKPSKKPTPTELPTFQPTELPTFHPTELPTFHPTELPTSQPTELPTSQPTKLPTSHPTQVPTSQPTSRSTTLSPTTVSLTTSSPTPEPSTDVTVADNDITFYVTAGRPSGELLKSWPDRLATLPTNDDKSFMVHLGDSFGPNTDCDEESFIEVDELYSHSSVPTYFVPGDSEWNDCPDPSNALFWWKYYFINYETWEPYFPNRKDVEEYKTRQGVYHGNTYSRRYNENFSFIQSRVLFIGINLVGAPLHDEDEWRDRFDANLSFIVETVGKQQGRFVAMFLFAQASPDRMRDIGNDDVAMKFYDEFQQYVQNDYDFPVVMILRNFKGEPWGIKPYYNGIKGFILLIVEGKRWPPMKLQLIGEDTLLYDQGSWYDNLGIDPHPDISGN